MATIIHSVLQVSWKVNNLYHGTRLVWTNVLTTPKNVYYHVNVDDLVIIYVLTETYDLVYPVYTVSLEKDVIHKTTVPHIYQKNNGEE